MKRKTLRRLRLSPNEESQLIREEQDRRRKIRIQQVREQARTNALHIRTDVQRRREKELQLLAEELRQDWELQQREKIQALQRLYEESLRLLGQGHRSAKENEPDWEAMAQHAEENQVKAKQRYREALKELTSQRHKDQEEHNRPANARRKALQAERERAARVASLPVPPPHPIETIEENRPHAGRSNVSGFSATHHHCLEPTVDREVAATQPDAHEEAQQEGRRLLEWRSEAERQREEQKEKARLRGRSALKREQLTQDRERLVVELEHMQQTELLRRRQQVAQMPAQIFQPLHRRREAREDGQRDMEFAFEDMYTGERRVKGDLVLKLVPEPLPAPSTTSSQDQELDVTVDDGEDTPLEVTPLEVTPETEAGHHGNGQHPGPATERVEPPQPAHRQALRKLLNRIRTQRDKGWDHVVEPIRTRSDQGRDHPQEPNLISSAAACQPPVQPDEEPERDSSIDTGSLSVEEPGRVASSPQLLPEPASVLETTGEESVLAPLPAEVLSSRMQEWKEREAALEREKRQQMVLLEELEEQKSRLEGMLLDAQRQREAMQAAVNQDVSLQEPEVPAHDQEANSDAPPPALSELEGSTVKDHSSRIRQHQQRLLEQNRVHQRSVEVARQRLEQYQRALRIRHSTAILPRPPTGPPAGLALHPPLNLSVKTAIPVATPPAVPRPTERAVPPSALREIPARRSDASKTPPLPRRPDLHPGPSLTRDPTRFPQDSPEDNANGPPPAHRAGLSAWLTDSIMERATGHLPESLRSPPAAPNPFTHRPLRIAENATTGVRQSSKLDTREPRLDTDPVPLLGPAAPPPGQASAKPQSFLRGHPVAQASLGPRKGDVERQRFKLLEAHRRMQEQREEVEQQLRKQEEEQRRREADRCSHEAQQRWEEESWRKAEEERCTQEERGRREEQQRHEEQRRLEEERWRREELQREEEQKRHDEEQREQMRRQREALQALINTETQGPGALPVAEPPATGEEEEVGRGRLSLLSSLLRAIEESHGGSLSHLEEQPQPAPCTPSPHASDSAPLRVDWPSQSWGAARAQKPPLTRVKLGAMVTLPGQHELSAIQEVETPGERSLVATGPEDVLGSQTLAAVGAPGSWDRHQRPGALLTHIEERSAVCSPLPDSEQSTALSWRKRLLEQPPETEPGPSRPSWGPFEQPLAAVGAPGSLDRHQRPGALLTHVEKRSAVCSPLPASELSTELSWRKRLLEQAPETEPGPSRPSWGPFEQPLAAVGAPGSLDRHQRPEALLTHVEKSSAVCSPLPASEQSTELSWKKRLLEQAPETEPGPSRPSWGPFEQPLAAVGAPGSLDRHQRPGALLTHVEKRSAVSSPLPASEQSTELSWRKRLLKQPPETEPGPSRPSWGPFEQPLAAVGAPGSLDRHQRPGALLTHVEKRSAVCSPLPASELSTELSWKKWPQTEPGPSRPSWGPFEQPLAAVGAPGSLDRHQRPGALLTHVEKRSVVCSPLPASEQSTELSWRKRLLEQPPETEPGPSRPSWGPFEQPLAAVGAPGSLDRHQRPGALLTHVEKRSAVSSPLPASEQSTELSWRKRLLEQPPETEPGPSRPSWGPCEQGGPSSGSSVSPGSVGSAYTANSESAGRPAYPDSFSSTSLSTGSYVTTDPEHNSAHTDVSEPHSGAELIRPVTPTDGFLTAVSPPSALSSRGSCSVALSSVADSQGPSSSPGPSFSMGPQTSPGPESSPGPETSPGSETSPGRAVAALFHESSIQRIIDKYTRELNASLCSSADTTGSSIALEENQVPQSPARVHTPATPLTETPPPRPGLEWDNAVHQILEQFSESVSLVQDISFRPLIGQLADQSSCLVAEGRHSAVARLIGQPSAQSSMIGQLPGPSMRAGANQGVWDSTMSRMIERLSHQPCSLWSSGGRDFYSSQLMGRLGLEQSSVSFDEAQEESRMRPLIGQLDESGVQRPGSTGGPCSSVDPTGSEPVQVLEDPPAPESPLHQPSAAHPPHQPSSHWPSSGQDRYASQLIGQPGLEATSLWLDDGPEEGGMKPLIGQLYDSAVQAAGCSGESSSSSSLGSVESVLVAPPPGQVPESSHRQPSAPLGPPHQHSSHQPSDGQLIRRLEFDQSSLWLDDRREEGGMRPLIGQLDESGGQAAGSSGYGSYRTDQTRLNRGPCDGTGGSPQAAVDPDLSAVPEPEVPDTRARPPLPDPSDLLQQDPACSEGFADQDSFHPLLAQVTLNESLEPSMTFHLPQQETPSSPEGSHQSTGREGAASADPPLSPHLSEEEDQGSLVDPSPEHPRAQEEEEEEEVPISSCLDSFCQLTSSQPLSVLLESPEEGEELMLGEGDETDGCKRLVPARDSTSKEPTNQPGFKLKSDAPIWDKIIGTAWEKGILEQSEITLVSLSDESMLGPDTTATEDEEQEVDSTLLPEEGDPPATQESPQSQPGVVLEPQPGPAGGLQEAFQRKRLALIQRSALRVEEIRAKRVLAKTQPGNTQGNPPQPSNTKGTPSQPSQTQGKPPQLTQAKTQSVQNRSKTKLIHSPTGPHLGQVRPEDHPRSKGQAPGQLVSSKTKEPQIKTMVVPVQTAVVPASRPDGKPKHPSPVSNAGMTGWEEVRTCTPSQKKLEGLEMHLRTRRLYGRLEEVKQQREVKSRQDSYAQNRLKAKEFHQKTLQKLRAKQTSQ